MEQTRDCSARIKSRIVVIQSNESRNNRDPNRRKYSLLESCSFAIAVSPRGVTLGDASISSIATELKALPATGCAIRNLQSREFQRACMSHVRDQGRQNEQPGVVRRPRESEPVGGGVGEFLVAARRMSANVCCWPPTCCEPATLCLCCRAD